MSLGRGRRAGRGRRPGGSNEAEVDEGGEVQVSGVTGGMMRGLRWDA